MNRDLQIFTDLFSRFFQPVIFAATRPSKAKVLLLEIGYLPPEQFKVFENLKTSINAIEELFETLSQLSEEEIEANPELIVNIIKNTVDNISLLIKDLKNISTFVQSELNGSALIAQTDILEALPGKLYDYLTIKYLKENQNRAYSILKLFGIIEVNAIQEVSNTFHSPHLERIFHWDRVVTLLTSPLELLKTAIKDDNQYFYKEVLYLLQELGFSLGLTPHFKYPNSDVLKFINNDPSIENWPGFKNLEILRFPLIPNDFDSLVVDIYPLINTVENKFKGLVLVLGFDPGTKEFTINDKFKLELELSGSVANGLGILLDENNQFKFITDLFSSPKNMLDNVQFGFKARILSNNNANSENEKMVQVGSPNGNRLEIGSINAAFGIEKKQDFRLYFEVELLKGFIAIKFGEADGFISKLVGDGIESNFNLGIGFSNEQGFYFTGSSGLEIVLPTHINLGPFEIQDLSISLKSTEEKLVFTFATSLLINTGPIKILVENIGISFPVNNSSSLVPAIGFKPPNGLGLSIDAGTVTGGGYLFFDFEKEEYAGVLELTIAGFISAKAIGLITTKMPDGSRGFSMLIIITAEFMPPFQLGYGFTLIAVGGLLGLNRTMLLDPLRNAVRTGAVNSIMFPQNVIANAPRIISDLKAIFPPYEGKFLIGPMGKLGWGTPTLISLSLGLIIEIPGNIAILGVLKIALPEERIPLIQIQVLFVGTIDFDKKMLTFDASLYESFILTMTLEGDMAVRLKWGDDPDFILTAGGFHPSYTPPPLALPTLRRMAINILNTDIAKIRIECYQAVTSNTVQFGSKAELYFGFSAISIRGHIQFDALFQFSPFYFIIEISGSVSLDIFGMGVFSIRLRFSLEGPTPWRAKGRGSISFFFFSVSANFDKTWGDSKNTSLPDITILPRFIEEINKREQWSTVLSSGKNLLVSLRKFDETASPPLVLHPAGSLVVQQKLLPLTVKFDKIGNQKTSDVQKVIISKAASAGVDLAISHVNENFARAQYQDLSDAEKLSKPSFEKMPGGISISEAGMNIKNGSMVRKKVEYEITIIDKEPQKPLKKGLFYGQPGLLFTHFLKGNSVSKSPLSKSYSEKLQPFSEKLAMQEEGYTVAFQANNKALNNTAGFASEMMAQSFMQEQIIKDPSLKKDIHIIPNYELQEL